MKIYRISKYILVYLLARGHWNLMVPVRADVEGDGSSGMSSADGGSSAETPAEGSGLAAPAAPEGSSSSPDAGSASTDGSVSVPAGVAADSSRAGPDAGSTAGDGSGHVAGGSDGDGSAGSPADGASSGEASTDPDATDSSSSHAAAEEKAEVSTDDDAGSPADGASSGEASTDPDATDSSSSHAAAEEKAEVSTDDDASAGSPADGAGAHVENAELVAKKESAKRLADEARKAGEEIIRRANELSKAIEESDDLEKFTAKLDASAYQLCIETTKLHESALPTDMMYYSSFPDGWHFGDPETLKEVRMFEIKMKEKVRAAIVEKKKVYEKIKKQIDELTKELMSVAAEIKKLEEEHDEFEKELPALDAPLIKLYKDGADGNLVEMVENTDFIRNKDKDDVGFEFKDGVTCALVKYGNAEVWKKGDNSNVDPNTVTYNDTTTIIIVRGSDWEEKNWRSYQNSSSDRIISNTSTKITYRGPVGTPESSESLAENEDKASVASGEGSEHNEADSGSALRGSASLDGEGSSGEGVAAADYSSVFMD
ncbi:hypothetical protein MACK_001754 [Theileria orientalis]|uniref:Uncharacterized protein n=1 Tax=Theileria orientalis TaxID=68886 RepID=A0A976QWT9_THEOR|nr:hypothetical protein MACK_001754 [Theileria orientalis]